MPPFSDAHRLTDSNQAILMFARTFDTHMYSTRG